MPVSNGRWSEEAIPFYALRFGCRRGSVGIVSAEFDMSLRFVEKHDDMSTRCRGSQFKFGTSDSKAFD